MNIRLNNIDLTRRQSLIMKIIRDAKINGSIRSTRWLHKLATKGRFCNFSSSDADNFANQIDQMITVLNRVHENRWDFHLHPIYDEFTSDDDYYFIGFKLYVIIHYPHVMITNSEGAEHEIQDLFVTFKIKNNNRQYVPCDFSGGRITYSYDEWFVGYRHSHLTSNKPLSFFDTLGTKDFCTGSGEINETLTNMWESDYIFDDAIFESFLYAIDSVVEWESIEGGPHIRMNKILIGGNETNATNISDANMKDWYRKLYNSISELDLDFVFSENRYKIKQNSKFEDKIKQGIIHHLQDYAKYLIVTKIGDNLYGYSEPIVETEEELIERFSFKNELPYTYIQGNKLEFKVLPFNGELKDISSYNVHPKFLDYAAKQLEQQLFYKSVRKSGIERYYQSINA